MKKLIILGSIVMGVVSLAQSNGVGEGSLRYGITLKGHQSNIKGIHDHSKARYAGAAGVFVEIPFAQRLASTAFLVPQVEYSMEGENAEPSSGKQQFHNDYVNALVYVKYFFPSSDPTQDAKWFAMLGPKLGFNINRKTTGEIKYAADRQAEDSFVKTSFGVSVGGGYRFSRMAEAFLRYDNGFTPVYDNYPGGGTFNYQLGVGINILFR